MADKTNCISYKGHLRNHQKGLTLVIFAFLIGLAITGLGIIFLSGGSYQIQQSVKSARVLAEAKEAILGYVVSGKSATGTGVFPCSEDTSSIGSSNEGQSYNCSNNATSIGRFAWRTMGVGELTDGNNDKLWYALSVGFRAVPINSDTIGQLSIDGTQNQAIAILFSPGTVLSTQSRPTPTFANAPIVSAYLEAENSDGDQDFITGVPSTTFNDKLVTIKADDIFPVLEKRVLGEFKTYLNAYKAAWGAFPFPAQFGNPTTATYVGVAGLTGGFLPISNTTPTTTWDTSSTPSPTVDWPPGNSGSNPACTFRGANTRIRCDITISSYNSSNPPTVSMSGVVSGIGFGFYDAMNVASLSDIQITTRSGSATVDSPRISHSLDAAGKGTVTFTGRLANTGVVRIEYRQTPQLSNWVQGSTNHYLLGGSSGNKWHHLVYYKVAAPFLPGAGGACGSCLNVNAINVIPNTTSTGIHALLMAAGRRLDTTNVRPSPTYGTFNPAQLRPGSLLTDYFDSSNNNSGGLVFDSTNHPLTTFNDQVQIVE